MRDSRKARSRPGRGSAPLKRPRSSASPIVSSNYLLEKSTPLTAEDKRRFAYFGVNAKILPPFRILNPQDIVIGDVTAIREGCHINAFRDLSFLLQYVDKEFRDAFTPEDYRYTPRIEIGRENQIGRFAFMSCTTSITLENNVLLSERVFIGDNNHGFSHPQVPIMQQPNKRGKPVVIGKGSWIGVGAAILSGTTIGQNCVVGANSVCRGGNYPSHSVIAPEAARILYRRRNDSD
jgi:acetyltransferase-like isoleucine patch superfamily enzyme